MQKRTIIKGLSPSEVIDLIDEAISAYDRQVYDEDGNHVGQTYTDYDALLKLKRAVQGESDEKENI